MGASPAVNDPTTATASIPNPMLSTIDRTATGERVHNLDLPLRWAD